MGKPGPKPRIGKEKFALKRNDLHRLLQLCWDKIDQDRLLRARTESEVKAALHESVGEPYKRELYAKAPPRLILEWIREGELPKERREYLLGHLVDSLAGEGQVSLRRSRDIAQAIRRAERPQGKILGVELYLRCTCGFQGISVNLKCRRCQADSRPTLMLTLGVLPIK